MHGETLKFGYKHILLFYCGKPNPEFCPTILDKIYVDKT